MNVLSVHIPLHYTLLRLTTLFLVADNIMRHNLCCATLNAAWLCLMVSQLLFYQVHLTQGSRAELAEAPDMVIAKMRCA